MPAMIKTNFTQEPVVKFLVVMSFQDTLQGNVFDRSFPNGGYVDPEADNPVKEVVPKQWSEVFQLIRDFMAMYPNLMPVGIKDVCESHKGFADGHFMTNYNSKQLLSQEWGIRDIPPIGQTIPQLAGGQPQAIDPGLAALMQQHGLVQGLNPMQEQMAMQPPQPNMTRTPQARALLTQLGVDPSQFLLPANEPVQNVGMPPGHSG